MRRRRSTLATVSLALVAALGLGCSDSAAESQSAPSPGGSARAAGSPASRIDPLAAYRADCPASAELSLECEWLRGLLVAEAVFGLQRLETARDRRGVPWALSALDLLGEPEILVAACRVLAHFADEPGIAEKVTPLLDSRFLEVERIGAQLLTRHPDPALSAMGREWIENHGGASVASVYDELDFPAHYDSMGFPAYPGAERYTPADSDRSIGWWSPDPAAEVAARLAQAAGTEAMTYPQWGEHAQQILLAAAQSMYDPAKMEELQKLTEQYMAKPDPALIARIEVLQKAMAGGADQAGADMAKAVDQVATPPGSAPYDQVFFLVAEPKPGRDARVIVVYRQPGVERTVMQMAWDLRDYPPAWKPAGEKG